MSIVNTTRKKAANNFPVLEERRYKKSDGRGSKREHRKRKSCSETEEAINQHTDLVASSKRYCQDREMSEDSLSFSDTSSQSDDSQDKLTSSGNGYNSGSSSGYPDSMSLDQRTSSDSDSTPPRNETTPPATSCHGSKISLERAESSPSEYTKYSRSIVFPSNDITTDSGISTTIDASDEERMLPSNPLKWSPHHVLQWLCKMEEVYKLPQSINKHYFSMNGIGLIFITKQGFVRRVGSKGIYLHQDIHHRLRTCLQHDR